MTDPKALEAVARALDEFAFGMLDLGCSGDRGALMRRQADEAREKAAKAFSALRAAGYAVVPVEATDDMPEADAVVDARAYAVGEDSEGRPRVTYNGAAALYRAMLEAASPSLGADEENTR